MPAAEAVAWTRSPLQIPRLVRAATPNPSPIARRATSAMSAPGVTVTTSAASVSAAISPSTRESCPTRTSSSEPCPKPDTWCPTPGAKFGCLSGPRCAGCVSKPRQLSSAAARATARAPAGSVRGLNGHVHDELVARIRYFDGHSDTLGLFADGAFLCAAARAIAEPFREANVEKVAGIEARGFILATAVALELRAGFVAIRKPGAIHPGPKAELTAPPDWRGHETRLRLQRHVVDEGDRVLVVDDWAETGSKALTARRLIEACGATYVGLSLLVDQLPDSLRPELEPIASVARADELREESA